MIVLGICIKDFQFLMFLNYYNLEFYFCKQIYNNFNIKYVFLNQKCYELLYVSKFELDCNLLCEKCKIKQIYRTHFKIIIKKFCNNFIFFVIFYDLTKGLQEFKQYNSYKFPCIYFSKNNMVYQKNISKCKHILKFLKQSNFYN